MRVVRSKLAWLVLVVAVLVLPMCSSDESSEVSCPASQTLCEGSCVNLNTSREHCSACGTACADGQLCNGSGECALSCQNGLTDCSGTCTNTQTDPAHCGGCGNPCDPGALCDGSGSCAVSCQSGLTDCGGTCTDTDVDPGNCGGCDDGLDSNTCNEGSVCDGAGVCALGCQGGLTDCSGTCTDTNVDSSNCGACDDGNGSNTCAAGEVCDGNGNCALSCQAGLTDCSGTCTDTNVDSNNCGGCDDGNGSNTCAIDEVCDVTCKPLPIISSVTPAVVPTTGGTTVTISGQSFDDIGGVTVLVGSVNVVPSLVTPTTVQFAVPANLGGIGSVDVLLANASGGVAVADDALYYHYGQISYGAGVSYPAGNNLRGLFVGDLDGDLEFDVATANYNPGDAYVRMGNGDGTLGTLVTYPGSPSNGLTGGDMNGDNYPDLVQSINSGGTRVLINQQDGTFVGTDYGYGMQMYGAPALADVTGDTFVDVVLPGRSIGVVQFGLGDGTLAGGTNVSAAGQHGAMAVALMNGDNLPDIVATITESNLWAVTVTISNGDGTFQPADVYNLPGGGGGITTGDFDGDQDVDVAASMDGAVQIYLNNGAGKLGVPTQLAVTGNNPGFLSALDLDLDGVLDLLVPTNGGNTVSYFRGVGDGTFNAAVDFALPNAGEVVTADLDGDTRTDIVARTSNSLVVLLSTSQ